MIYVLITYFWSILRVIGGFMKYIKHVKYLEYIKSINYIMYIMCINDHHRQHLRAKEEGQFDISPNRKQAVLCIKNNSLIFPGT